jgi:endoglucanase
LVKRLVHLFAILSLLTSIAGAQAAVGYTGKPYKGNPQVIPGRVEAEFYDEGGPGVAYEDADAVNNGSGKLNTGSTDLDTFRKDEGVDISYTKALDKKLDGTPEHQGDLYVGWTEPNEWLKYTVDVQKAGTYRIDAHMSSRFNDAEISIAVHSMTSNDKSSTGTVVLPGTGDWHTWRMFENIGTVRLNKGPHVMIVSVLKRGNFNIDYFDFVPVLDTAKPFTPIDPFVQVKQMQRGVNIIGYDPIWKDFERARFKQEHFKNIHDGGFNTIRVNLQAFQHMDSMNRLSPAWLKTMDWVVDNAIANDLTVIIDEHDYEPCGKNADYCRTKLLAFWEQVAARYKDAPNNVIFEILNEPNSAITVDGWNSLLSEALSVIRRTNPERNVVIGPAFWNGFNRLDTLRLPADDHHIIATVHYYAPHRFTHQGAYWSKETMNLSGITWGTDAEKQTVIQDFDGVQAWSKANNRPILLGEFGAYDKAGMEDRVRYDSFIARTAESMGWAWTYWQFDADFVVWSMDKNDWVAPIHNALIPPSTASERQ